MALFDSYDEDEDRFVDSFPYTYDTETGYTQTEYANDGYWVDSVGNKYEQVTDCWGTISYEKVEDDTDSGDEEYDD